MTANPSTRFPLVAPAGSVLAREKPWTRTADEVAELTALVERRTAERADANVAARIADAVTAEQDDAYPRWAAALDGTARLKRPPKWLDVPEWAVRRYERERSAV